MHICSLTSVTVMSGFDILGEKNTKAPKKAENTSLLKRRSVIWIVADSNSNIVEGLFLCSA